MVGRAVLLRGQQALEALHELLTGRDGIAAVEMDPGARSGKPLELVAVAAAGREILIDARSTPGLGEALSRVPVLGGWDAKAIHRALLRRHEPGPSRWACIRITEQLLAGGRPWKLSFEEAARRLALPTPPAPEEGFAALTLRARAAAEILALQMDELKRDELRYVSKLEAAAISAVAHMEQAGMRVDAERWRALTVQSTQEREAVRRQLGRHLAQVSGATLFGDANINLDADAELKAALHKLGYRLPNVRRASLSTLPAPLGPLLLRYRELTKLVTAYGDNFLQHVHPDGRVRPTFEQIGASTGRMACHAPNLQAVVKSGPFRECFTCEPHRRLVIGDYATCELRILAEVSGDPVFAEAFARGDDLHATVAASLFRQPVSKDTNPELRHRAKAINFGLVYGMGAGGLARQLDTDLDTARRLLNDYFRTFPRIRRYLEGNAQASLRRGYARTLAGRRLYLSPGLERSERAAAERVAKNMPIQGTSADITKIALAKLHQALGAYPGARLVNTVHDEIVIECDAEQSEAVAATMRSTMEAAGAELLRNIPLRADVAISRAWNK